MRRLALLFLAIPIIAYQIRFGLDAIWAMQSFAVYLPFDVRPFSNRFAMQISPGQELLAVNGKPFVAYSTYVRELWRVARQPDDAPNRAAFAFTVRDPGRPVTRTLIG